ncbi:hypothetical protein K8Q94_01045 [Candidatus Nomurabacteria bacterium]|nr:hypothetical protein [Candidatus Nomurabacteria bacterium]
MAKKEKVPKFRPQDPIRVMRMLESLPYEHSDEEYQELLTYGKILSSKERKAIKNLKDQ